ncbi:UPF0496 protein 4-like [Rutidosis leptorrhynchoides]|uniref:UPF0496 protein 4-like n=1 Tax=Rutidosis leptorrhynchoides TaxID=125765 RepID=UPI003A99A022
MDYSLKVLDMCNLISSAVQRLTDRRLLMNFTLRLLNFTDQVPAPEKLNKSKDVLARCVNGLPESAPEKARRAKALTEELTGLLSKLPRGKSDTGRDLIRRTFTALITLTIFVGSVLVTVLFGEFDFVKPQVPAEFLFADLVNGEWTRIFDLIKPEQNAVLEIDDVASQAKVVHDLIDSINAGDMAQLEAGVKALATAAKKYSDGIDLLTNGVNGMFQTVLKTRNGRLVI